MKTHTFIEFKNGKYETIKKFLHLTGGGIEVPEERKNSDALCEIHYIVLLTNEGCARDLLRKYILKLGYKSIEGYPKPDDLNFGDIDSIKSVKDLKVF